MIFLLIASILVMMPRSILKLPPDFCSINSLKSVVIKSTRPCMPNSSQINEGSRIAFDSSKDVFRYEKARLQSVEYCYFVAVRYT